MAKPNKSAISLGIAVVIVVALILIAGFGAFLASDFNNQKVTSTTRTVTVTDTLSGTLSTASTQVSLFTITEHLNTKVIYVFTHDIVTNSSTTYTCLINPTLQATTSIFTTYAPLTGNITGAFSAKIVTISSNTTTTTYITVTQPYPLTTSITTQNGSAQVVTVCSAETG